MILLKFQIKRHCIKITSHNCFRFTEQIDLDTQCFCHCLFNFYYSQAVVKDNLTSCLHCQSLAVQSVCAFLMFWYVNKHVDISCHVASLVA